MVTIPEFLVVVVVSQGQGGPDFGRDSCGFGRDYGRGGRRPLLGGRGRGQVSRYCLIAMGLITLLTIVGSS